MIDKILTALAVGGVLFWLIVLALHFLGLA